MDSGPLQSGSCPEWVTIEEDRVRREGVGGDSRQDVSERVTSASDQVCMHVSQTSATSIVVKAFPQESHSSRDAAIRALFNQVCYDLTSSKGEHCYFTFDELANLTSVSQAVRNQFQTVYSLMLHLKLKNPLLDYHIKQLSPVDAKRICLEIHNSKILLDTGYSLRAVLEDIPFFEKETAQELKQLTEVAQELKQLFQNEAKKSNELEAVRKMKEKYKDDNEKVKRFVEAEPIKLEELKRIQQNIAIKFEEFEKIKLEKSGIIAQINMEKLGFNAIEKDCPALLKLVLDSGLNPNMERIDRASDERESLVMHAIRQPGSNSPCLQVLLNVRAAVDMERHDARGETPFMVAARHGFMEKARMLQRAGANVNAHYDRGNYKGKSVIHNSLSTAILREILRIPGMNILDRDETGRTVLMNFIGDQGIYVFAAYKKLREILEGIKYIAGYNAQMEFNLRHDLLEARDNSGRTALMIALENHQKEYVGDLVLVGANTEAVHNGRTVREIARELDLEDWLTP